MLQAAGSLVAIAVLIGAGVVMARRGWLGDRAVDGLKTLITRLTLPLLLFRAFLQLAPEGRNAVLALAVFAACAVMGGVGAALQRAARLPRPETRLLFQGFEAGMLGYALFVALHGDALLPAFAALDMGQVVYVFTALMVQMSVLEQHRVRELSLAAAGGGRQAPSDGRQARTGTGQAPGDGGQAATGAGPAPGAGGQAPTGTGQAPDARGQAPTGTGPAPDARGQAPTGTGQAPTGTGQAPGAGAAGPRVTFPWRDIAMSTVLWAIVGGLAISLSAPGVAAWLSGPDGPAAPVFDTIGGLTTPLVCLVIGASLAGGIPRDPAIVAVVGLRTVVGLGLGLLFGLVVVPALGFSTWHAKAAIMLFVLPAPFVIPVYYRRNAAFVGSVLTLGTAVSIALIAVLAVLGVA